jgi:glucose-1-phosphate adenylyltransferase
MVPQKGDLVCLETYVIKKSLLIEIIKNCCGSEEYDFLKDGVKANLTHVNVKGYHFTGYLPFIHSLSSFYASNMDFLKPELTRSMLYDTWDVFTKVKHEPPVKYLACSNVSNSLIANGCEIEGVVENSIICRGVKVKKGAVVKNSIIMQNSVIEEGAFVENVITDKQVKITVEQIVRGGDIPRVIKKAAIV